MGFLSTAVYRILLLKIYFFKNFNKFCSFDIIFDTNPSVVNYFDLMWDLNTEICYSYQQPNRSLQYINVSSNHPSSKLINTISIKVSNLSADKEIFNQYALIYNNALKVSRLKENIYYIRYIKLKSKIEYIDLNNKVGISELYQLNISSAHQPL